MTVASIVASAVVAGSIATLGLDHDGIDHRLAVGVAVAAVVASMMSALRTLESLPRRSTVWAMAIGAGALAVVADRSGGFDVIDRSAAPVVAWAGAALAVSAASRRRNRELGGYGPEWVVGSLALWTALLGATALVAGVETVLTSQVVGATALPAVCVLAVRAAGRASGVRRTTSAILTVASGLLAVALQSWFDSVSSIGWGVVASAMAMLLMTSDAFRWRAAVVATGIAAIAFVPSVAGGFVVVVLVVGGIVSLIEGQIGNLRAPELDDHKTKSRQETIMNPRQHNQHEQLAGRRLVTRLGGALAVLVAVAFSPGMAEAASDSGTGWARFGHFAPTVAAVDVSVDGEAFAAGIDFKAVSEYGELSAGVHTFEVRPAGEPDATPAITVQATVPADGAITIGAVSSRDGVATQVFDDELVTPEADQALVRFIHAAPESAAVDIMAVGAGEFATAVPYPEATQYQTIAPGRYDVSITDSDSGEVVLQVTGWEIAAGQQSTVVVVQGNDGALDVAPVVDAVAMAVAPTGGVPTGFGGMSDALAETSSIPWSGVAAGAVALLVGLAGVTGRRRSSQV